jgi:chromosome segregation ATPase
MKTRIAFWGTNPENEKCLLALELLPQENKVLFRAVPEKCVTDTAEETIFKSWRTGASFEWPEETSEQTMDFTAGETLLPDGYTPLNGATMQQAKADWAFMVISTKMAQLYKTELEDIKEKIHGAEQFKDHLWDDLKGFWEKVQSQINSRTLLREHTNELREVTNGLFGKLKELKTQLESSFKEVSEQTIQPIIQKCEDITRRLESGARFNALFEELKQLQNELKDMKISRQARNTVWNKLDVTFKAVKEKRNGAGSNEGIGGANDRITARLNGLLEAIRKMEQSIQRDKNEWDFLNRRIESSGGQLEAQLRMAKLTMVEERMKSKDAKLSEMKAIQTELEGKLQQIAIRQAKKEEDRKIAAMKEEAKEKIASQIKEGIKATHEEVAAKRKNGTSSRSSAKKEKEHVTEENDDVLSKIIATADSISNEENKGM